jgi:ABC-type multidrug transport system ATPase subunit
LNALSTTESCEVKHPPCWLVIKGLTKTYANGIRAMQDISLDIDRGIFGLLGPNGAGKSTLMRTLATLQEPDTGGVELDGVALLDAPHRASADFGTGNSSWDAPLCRRTYRR